MRAGGEWKRMGSEKKKYISRRIKRIFLIQLSAFFVSALFLLLFAGEAGIRIFALAAIFAELLFLLFAYRYLVLPLRETLRIYKQFSGGYVLSDIFALRYPLSLQSEAMIRRFGEMINRDELINIYKKEAEYLALQNQINPHFLYNTLEGIRSEALLAGEDAIAEMTEALATFFRYTISKVDHLVTLEEELENIENYYYIQQFRFGDRLSLKIEYEVGEEEDELQALELYLPKLTLQPIIENSIYHGLETKPGRGSLLITISLTDQRLILRVSDDGIGMEQERLLRLNNRLKSLSLEGEPQEKAAGGIALVNVNNRIKLLFGEEYGIYVYSHIGAGTDVEISLPRVESGQDLLRSREERG